MSQVVDRPALEAGRSKERQVDSQGLAQVAHSLPPEAGWSSLSQDSSALKAGQSLQHGPGVADGPAFETGWSAAT
jgi:hypothetical protein